MGTVNWAAPPPLYLIGGDQDFLRDREVRKAIRLSVLANIEIVRAESLGEIVDTLSMASNFGGAFLIVAPGHVVTTELLQSIKKKPVPRCCLLIVVDGSLTNEKKLPFLPEVHGAYQVEYETPTDRKGRQSQALSFVQGEAARLLGRTDALSDKLAEALVKNVGDDLGVLSYEISKMSAHARFEGKNEITVECVRGLIRASTDIDLEPLREALKIRDTLRVASALDRIRRTGGPESVMLLLRGKGGPADLAMKWLRTALLLEKGAQDQEIAARTGTPIWAVSKDLIPAAKRWGAPALRKMVRGLAVADRGVLLGSPSPWSSCEAALLSGCIPSGTLH